MLVGAIETTFGLRPVSELARAGHGLHLIRRPAFDQQPCLDIREQLVAGRQDLAWIKVAHPGLSAHVGDQAVSLLDARGVVDCGRGLLPRLVVGLPGFELGLVLGQALMLGARPPGAATAS